MRRARGGLVAVLCAGLVLLGGGPASAGPIPQVHTYGWLSCLSGTGEILSLVRDSAVPPTYGLIHTVTPCVTPSPTKVYAVATYGSDGTTWGDPLTYPPTTAAYAATVAIWSDVVAVCLLTRPDHRVACAGIVVDAAGVAALGAAVPVDAPSVSMPAEVILDGPPPQGPICPPCWLTLHP
jgi:hypothetical protein